MKLFVRRPVIRPASLLSACAAICAACPAVSAQDSRPAEPKPPASVERNVLIAVPVDRVWEAFFDPGISADWFPFPLIKVERKVGGELIYGPNGQPAMIATILELREHERLVLRMRFVGGAEILAEEQPTRLTLAFSDWGPTTQIHLIHDEMEASPMTAMSSGAVWDANLSKLKTRLETGKRMAFSYDEARTLAQGPQEPVATDKPFAYVRAVTVLVDKLPEARPWYEKLFELPLSGFSKNWISFAMGSPQVIVREADAAAGEKPGQVMLSFGTENVEALYRRLQREEIRMAKPLTCGVRTCEFEFLGPHNQRFHVRGPAPEPATASRPAASAPAPAGGEAVPPP